MPKHGIGMSYFHFSQTQSPFIAAIGDKAVLMDTNSFSVINSKYFFAYASIRHTLLLIFAFANFK